ncbi:MAG: trigger factor [Puniceicoccales bacterium]|nr:trigger factor [Puniceicoccales bacterium]
MSINIKEISPTRKAVTLIFPAATIATLEGDVIKEISKEARLPGFRPGRAPVQVIRRQFADTIANETKQRLVGAAVQRIRDETKLKLIDIISTDGLDELTFGGDFSLHLVIDHQPEFELPEYKGLELPLAPVEVSEADVDRVLADFRAHYARYEVVERPAEKGDFVKLSYEGTIDGAPVKDVAPAAYLYGTQAATWEEAGGSEDTRHIPAIVQGILGKKPGDKDTFLHVFPDDFGVEALRGKTATYAVEIFEVRAKILPELDEEFYKRVEAKDLDDLRSQLRERVLATKQNQAKAAQRDVAVEKLLALVDFPVPEVTIEAELQTLFMDYAAKQLRNDVSVEGIKEGRQAFCADARPEAERQGKLRFILREIILREKISVAVEDLVKHVEREAALIGKPPEQHIKEVLKDKAYLAQMRAVIAENKALDLVIQNAKA